MTQTSPSGPKQLASDRPIGHIEAVFEFYDAMPTGVSVAADGRIFINFPRWAMIRHSRSARSATARLFPIQTR